MKAADQLSVIFGALADPTRFLIALALRDGEELCVCDLAWITGRPENLVGHHLRTLRDAQLATSRREHKIVFYTLTDEYPVFHLTCVTHRKNPIYAATIVGKPPMEDAWMGKAVERIFLPAMRMQIPELVDIHLPVEAVFHNLMLVSIRKSYPGHARKVMNAIWSLGQAMFTEIIIVVDEDCDLQNVAEVVLRVANNIDPERDIQFTLGPVDSLDHSSRLPNYGSKMGIDATRKWKAEGFNRPWPAMIEMDRATKAKVDALWAKLGL